MEKMTDLQCLCAHRGAHKGVAPENSMPAFEKALELGTPEIEIDLWPSKDGEMFVEGVKGSTFSCVSFASAESCFTVVAVNGAGESEHSNEVCVSVGEGVAEKEAAFNIYPNPVKDKLYIETGTVINEVSIFDIYGRKQLAVSGQLSAFSRDVSTIPKIR